MLLEAHHRFVPEETDWGFTRFSELHKLFHPAEGQSRPVIENDACDIYAYVKVFKDPTGVLWHNFNKYACSIEMISQTQVLPNLVMIQRKRPVMLG